MSLQKQALAQGIIALQNDMVKKNEPAIEEYANRLADLIDTFVKSGIITVDFPIPVTVAANLTGGTTSTGTGTIS